METDIWGQLALEASQVYLTDGVKRSPFADTVRILLFLPHFWLCLFIYGSKKIVGAGIARSQNNIYTHTSSLLIHIDLKY